MRSACVACGTEMSQSTSWCLASTCQLRLCLFILGGCLGILSLAENFISFFLQTLHGHAAHPVRSAGDTDEWSNTV